MTTLTTNMSGGTAYAMSDVYALFHYAVLGVAGTVSEGQAANLKRLAELAKPVSREHVAKIAVYARESGAMKDTPIALLAYLASIRAHYYVTVIFDRVIQNTQDLRKFVTYMRNGSFGVKSLGTFTKKTIANWLNKQSAENLYWQSIGTADMSMGDVIKLAHPKPIDAEHCAMYAHFIGQNLPEEYMSPQMKRFEDFKKDPNGLIPVGVPLMKYMSLMRTSEQWKQAAQRMSWNQLRLNLNNLAKHGVFQDPELKAFVISRLSQFDLIPNTVWPIAIYTTLKNVHPSVPSEVTTVLDKACTYLLKKAPDFGDKKTVVFVDVSGSMGGMIHTSKQTSIRYKDIAMLYAAAIAKSNKNADVYTFDTTVKNLVQFNKQDTIQHMIQKIPFNGGGTAVSSTLEYLIDHNLDYDNIIIISDNESWADRSPWNIRKKEYTSLSTYWNEYLKTHPNSKLALIDIEPRISASQIQESASTFNISGYSDATFLALGMFMKEEQLDTVYGLLNDIKLV